MSFFSRLLGKNRHITVPPGHKVNVIHPVATAYLGKCESAVWIADLGQDGQFEHVVSQVEQLAFREKALVVWIVQIPIMESPLAFEPLLARLSSIIQQSRGFAGHCAVVPHATHRHAIQMRRLMDTGAGVHYSADDGACFIEVHRPDGIVIGMPGKPFAPGPGPADETKQRTISDLLTEIGPGEALDLEQAIFNVAEHRRDEDFRVLYAVLRGRELHIPVQTPHRAGRDKVGPTIHGTGHGPDHHPAHSRPRRWVIRSSDDARAACKVCGRVPKHRMDRVPEARLVVRRSVGSASARRDIVCGV